MYEEELTGMIPLGRNRNFSGVRNWSFIFIAGRSLVVSIMVHITEDRARGFCVLAK